MKQVKTTLLVTVDPLAYLCGIEDPERIRLEAAGLGVTIIKQQVVEFLQGHGVQFTLELKGVQGFLVPTSPAARERQKRAGRYLSPYNWVASKEREDVVVHPPEETKP